ncbi:MAG: hypothetical protein AAFU85_17180 [Planctomycetota bacterium]
MTRETPPPLPASAEPARDAAFRLAAENERLRAELSTLRTEKRIRKRTERLAKRAPHFATREERDAYYRQQHFDRAVDQLKTPGKAAGNRDAIEFTVPDAAIPWLVGVFAFGREAMQAARTVRNVLALLALLPLIFWLIAIVTT